MMVAVVVAGCGAVQKPPEPSRRLDLHMVGEMFDSDRGYRFAVLPEPGAKVVRLDVRYPVGAADDPPGKEGLAHLVEHLLFDVEFARGEQHTSIGAELGRLALSWNAETRLDSTTYWVLAPPKALDELLALEVDRLAVGCAGLTPEIVAREREVVINELRQNQGTSGADTQRKIHEAVFPVGHPYRPVDSIDTVAKLELADVCQFMKTAYHRGRGLVIASGAVYASAVRAAAAKSFARLGKRDLSPKAIPPLVTAVPGTQRLKVDIEEPMLVVTWPLPRMASKEYRLLELAWDAIGPRLAGSAFEFGWGHTSDTWIIGGPYAPVLAVSVTLQSLD
jgi:zinc protease